MGIFDDAKDFVDDTVDDVVDTVTGGDNDDQNQDSSSGSGGSGGDTSSSGGYSLAPDTGSDSSDSSSSGTGDATPGEAGGGYSTPLDDPFGGSDDDDDDTDSSSGSGGSSNSSDTRDTDTDSGGSGDATPDEPGGGYSEAQDDPFSNYDGDSSSGSSGNSGGSGDNTLRNTDGEIVGKYSPGGSLEDTEYNTGGSDNDSGPDTSDRNPVQRGTDRTGSTDSGPEVVQAQDQGREQPRESKTLFEGTTPGGNTVEITRDYVRDPQTGEYESALVIGQSDPTQGQSQVQAVAAAARNRATEIGGIPGQQLSDFADKIDQVNSNFEDSEFQMENGQLYISGENQGQSSGGSSQESPSAYEQFQRGDPLAADAAMVAPGDETPDFGYGDDTPEYYGRTQLDQPEMYQSDEFRPQGASRRALNRMPSQTRFGLNVQQDVSEFTENEAFGRAAGQVAATGYQAYRAPLAADAFLQQAARNPEKAVNQLKQSLESTGRQIAGTAGVADDVQTAVMATPGSRLANEQLAQSQFGFGAVTGAATGAAAGGAVRGLSAAGRSDVPDYAPSNRIGRRLSEAQEENQFVPSSAVEEAQRQQLYGDFQSRTPDAGPVRERVRGARDFVKGDLGYEYSEGRNPDHEDGRGLSTDQYWPGDDRLLDWPRDVSTLLDGVNTLTLTEVDQEERQSPLLALLEEVYSSEFSADEPLFLFVEEAQTLNDEPKQLLKQIVKEKRKHNVHCVLVTQNPMQFKRQYADIRRNTSTVFLHGEYFSYADDFELLESKREMSKLGRGQAILHSLDLPKVTVDVRRPVSRVEEPTEAMIDRLNRQYEPRPVDLGETSKPAQEGDDELLEWIRQWLAENPEYDYITASKCWRPTGSPGSSSTINDELNRLAEEGMLEHTGIERGHNKTIGYKPTS